MKALYSTLCMTDLSRTFVQKMCHETTYSFSISAFMKSERMLMFNDIFLFVLMKGVKEFSVHQFGDYNLHHSKNILQICMI